MSEELQTAETQEANTGTSDLAPGGTGENQSNQSDDGGKVEFSPEQQKVFDAAINRQHSKYREAERAKQDTQAQLTAANGRISDFEANQPKPVIPKLPDRFDFDSDGDFDAAVATRDATIVAVAQHQQIQANIAQAATTENEQAQLAEQQVRVNNAQTLVENSAKLGISNDDLGKATAVVGSYNLSTEIRTGLMTDPDGPVMLAYLAANPLEVEALQNMGVFDASNHLGTVIRQKASALKPKTSDAPPPPDVLSGNGAPEGKGKLPNDMGYTLE